MRPACADERGQLFRSCRLAAEVLGGYDRKGLGPDANGMGQRDHGAFALREHPAARASYKARFVPLLDAHLRWRRLLAA